MARAIGARAVYALAFESTYGVAATAGTFFQLPVKSVNTGAAQDLVDQGLIGMGRDPLAPLVDARVADGDVNIGLDTRYVGLWLKAVFGAPVSVGVTPAAVGTITFSDQPAVASAIQLNGTTFTFVATGATGNQINIGANLAATMTATAVALNASVVPGVALATYAAVGGTQISVTYDVLGAAANSFTLFAGGATNGTVSGATLTGGVSAHTFSSGAWTLPSVCLETFLPEVPHQQMFLGGVVDKLAMKWGGKGAAEATVSLIGQKETVGTASAAGALTAYAVKRFMNLQGQVKRAGVLLSGTVQSADLTYMNNLDRIDTVQGDGLIAGADPTQAGLSGSLTLRFDSQTLLNQAISGAPCALEFSNVIDASNKLVIAVPEAYLARPKVTVDGPNGVQVTTNWQGAFNAAAARMCSFVLTNDIGAY